MREEITQTEGRVLRQMHDRMLKEIDGLTWGIFGYHPTTAKRPCQCSPIGVLAHHEPGCHNAIA